MQPERLPQLGLAQGLVRVVEELEDLSDQDKRMLLNRFSEVLRPVCKAAEEGYQRGFDDGAQYREKSANEGPEG